FNLLRESLTHRSFKNENRFIKWNHNERIEFLGDAVLELIVTEYLFKIFLKPEGELTLLRSALVNTNSLAAVAEKINLEKFLFLGRGELVGEIKAKKVILADALEALIGAIYLDQGFMKAKEFINKFIIIDLQKSVTKIIKYKDPKTLLQEIVQAELKKTPQYEIISETGPAHEKIFITAAVIDGKSIARGKGTSKQEAEIEAAKKALIKFQRDFKSIAL
ncbi:MAG: ribonuclease III, partial [Patescibacteria group bacterium]